MWSYINTHVYTHHTRASPHRHTYCMYLLHTCIHTVCTHAHPSPLTALSWWFLSPLTDEETEAQGRQVRPSRAPRPRAQGPMATECHSRASMRGPRGGRHRSPGPGLGVRSKTRSAGPTHQLTGGDRAWPEQAGVRACQPAPSPASWDKLTETCTHAQDLRPQGPRGRSGRCALHPLSGALAGKWTKEAIGSLCRAPAAPT